MPLVDYSLLRARFHESQPRAKDLGPAPSLRAETVDTSSAPGQETLQAASFIASSPILMCPASSTASSSSSADPAISKGESSNKDSNTVIHVDKSENSGPIRRRRTEVEILRDLWKQLPYWINRKKRNATSDHIAPPTEANGDPRDPNAPKAVPTHWGSTFLLDHEGRRVRRSRRVINHTKLLTAS